jgi:hypothetical protein
MLGSSIKARRGAGRLAGMIGSLEIYQAGREAIAITIAEISICLWDYPHRRISLDSGSGSKSVDRRLFDDRRHFYQSAIDHLQSPGGSEGEIEHAAPRERAAVVDDHNDAAPGPRIGNP